MTLTLYVTWRNTLSWVVTICVVALAVMPILVHPEDMGKLLWRYLAMGLGFIAFAATISLNSLQTAEDEKRARKDAQRDQNDSARDETIKELRDLARKSLNLNSDEIIVEALPDMAISIPSAEVSRSTTVDGELYRLVLSPRTMSWPLLRDLYRVQGNPENASVDCDLLLEMYLVNRSDKEKYVRDLRLSCEVNGVRVSWEMQRDLRALDSSGHRYEYALEVDPDFYSKEQTLKPLLSEITNPLLPEQPSEGWVRFLKHELNPDQINSKSWQLTVIDSIGNEYPINRVSEVKRVGEIGIRRIA